MKVFVVDSHAIYRRGLVASLELLETVDAVEQAASVEEAERSPALDDADVAIVDTSITGARALVGAIARRGRTRVIACTSQGGPEAVADMITAGAVGYLRKDSLDQDVLQAGLAATQSGVAVMGRDLLAAMLGRGEPSDVPTATPPVPAPMRGGRLTEREQQVLELIADGLATREVAARLSYSERTVKNALHDVVVKLNARSRSQAVACAVRDGLI